MIAVLCGGVGAARFLQGLVEVVDPALVTAIVNTGDDLEWNTLRVCPDLDTVTYTLAGAHATTGWGLEGETWNVRSGLERFGAPTWFGIGDRDLATHLYRSQAIASGMRLHQVTAQIAAAWGLQVRLLPMTDDDVRTKLTIDTGEEIDFQEYFVHRHHDVVVQRVRFDGADDAQPAPGVLDALERADAIVIAPSNPIISIGPIVALPGIAQVLARRRQRVLAISPIVGGRALKGPADRLLIELGFSSDVAGVARALTHVCATMVIDEQDRADASLVEACDLRCVVTETVMTDVAAAANLARAVCGALGLDVNRDGHDLL